VEWGIEQARQKNLTLYTEAGIKGVGLYRKMGFEQVGVWKVATFEMPIMKLATR
jgi:hypothetical protein